MITIDPPTCAPQKTCLLWLLWRGDDVYNNIHRVEYVVTLEQNEPVLGSWAAHARARVVAAQLLCERIPDRGCRFVVDVLEFIGIFQ